MSYWQIYSQANELFSQGNYQESIPLYEQCIELQPQKQEIYLNLGLAFLLTGEREKAEAVWMSLLFTDASNFNCLFNYLQNQLNSFAGEDQINMVCCSRIYTILKELDNDYQDRALENRIDTYLAQILEQALAMSLMKKHEKAIILYQQYLEIKTNNAYVWHNLGLAYYELANYQEAYQYVDYSLKLDSNISIHYHSYAKILEKLNQVDLAIQAYEKALELDRNFYDAYNDLANLLKTIGALDAAENIYQKITQIYPDYLGGYINLGNIYITKHNWDSAIENYQKALALEAGNPITLHNLGYAFALKEDLVNSNLYYGYSAYYEGEYEKAIDFLTKVINTGNGDVDCFLNLAVSSEKLGKITEAISTCKIGIEKHNNDPILYRLIILLYQKYEQVEEAIHWAEIAINKFPEDLSFLRLNQNLLPVIYQSLEEIDFYRNRFANCLDDLDLQVKLDTEAEKMSGLSLIKRITNFYLHYQGKNDLELQKKYANLVSKIMVANYPQWGERKNVTQTSKEAKIKIGYILKSTGFIISLYLNWLKNHNKNNFEIFGYFLGDYLDIYPNQIKFYCDYFYHFPSNFEKAAEQIVKDNIQILTFLEIGMDPMMTQIAGLRLAPIQCVTWGHPITTGSPTIDYFLSSELIEPDNADEHYSETLIKLPNLGMIYQEPELPKAPRKRSDFGLKDNDILYLSCQALCKYLPQYDYIFPSIAQKVPEAKFIFIESYGNFTVEKFQQRLGQKFQEFGLEFEDFCLMMPRQEQGNYLNLCQVCDVFLDTFGFSGGFTTVDAIASNLPIVTCPKEFMRGRQSYGMLKLLGVRETIAKTELEYIEIAIKLGSDLNWRTAIQQKIETQKHLLFTDTSSVQVLEKFYRQAVIDKSLN